MQNENCKQKHKQTCEDKYGVQNVFQAEEIKQVIKETHLHKRGVDHPSKCESVKDKKKETLLTNYGVDNPLRSQTIKDRVMETFETRYGVRWNFQAQEVKDKIKTTNLEQWGVVNPSQAEEIKSKRKETFQAKYGVDNPFCSEEIRDKITQTNYEKYGVPYPPHPHKTQDEIQEWLNSFGFSFNETWSVLRNKQIDLYEKQLKIAFEYCGLYWHTENSPTSRNKLYHFDKYKRCEELGIRLITIFSDEWLLRNKQCKNFIKSVLGKNEHVHARKCKIVELPKEEFNRFVDENHIQGAVNRNIIRFGLLYNDLMIGGMSLGRHPRNKTLVLDRLCFADNYSVSGGASKLFFQCKKWLTENNYNNLVSFSDNRWSQGNVYKALGFKLDKAIAPDYSYVNMRSPFKRLSKQSQKKSNTCCPPDLTEKEWAAQNGLARIWDCGKKRWKIEL